MSKSTTASSFPQFRLLPAELRCQIWELALLPTPSVLTITLSDSRWDPLDTQAYDGASFELVQGSMWHFAFAPRRALPTVLFTCQEAFSVGQKYYHLASQIGHEIIDETIITDLTTADGEIIPQDYSSSMPVVKRKERAIPCSMNDLVHVNSNRKISIEKDHPLSYHAISDLHPLSFQGIKYLVMDAMEFYNRMYVRSSNSLIFSELEVLFLVLGRYDDGEGGRDILNNGAVDVWDFLNPWERSDLEAGMTKWNAKEVELVGSVEHAVGRVRWRDI
jgi:hypothetical protein